MTIRVPFRAVGEARPRVVTKGGKTFAYSPKSKEREGLRMLFSAELGEPFLDKLVVIISCRFRPPKSWSDKKRCAAIGIYKGTKPDIDNLLKFILDAGNGVLWEDDRQIVGVSIEKVYAERDEIVIGIKQRSG